MHFHCLALPYSFLRQCFNEIHAADRLGDITIDDLTCTLRLHEPKDEEWCCKACRPQLECLRERCYREVVRPLIERNPRCGDRSVSVCIRLHHST